MILEVQIQIFSALAHAWQSFHFQKIPRGLNINIFCENLHEASFYIKEQTQKNKFEIWVFKTTILDPRKGRFWFLKKKTNQKTFSSRFGFQSALKIIDAQMSFWLVLLKTH